jgi:glycosyltransferase involved in cell wall biosynthesis
VLAEGVERMSVSVLIPTYNSARTIRATVESVLSQTAPPDEILVLDDGSTDKTVAILRSYEPQVAIFEQENAGVAAARNALCALASGDVVAFLDHDDLWHPKYLEVQLANLSSHPDAVASFTGHLDFAGLGPHLWSEEALEDNPTRTIGPRDFLCEYNTVTGRFGSASFLCLPRRVFSLIEGDPFKVSGVDDSYLCTWLPLLGPVVYTETHLVAYRLTRDSQSANRLKSFGLWVQVFLLLEPHYRSRASDELLKIFETFFASKRRQYAKRLLGAGRSDEGRRELLASLRPSHRPASISKSLWLLFASYLPDRLQPEWPKVYREVEHL